MRNCGIIAFAVNTHLNYVSAFTFQMKTQSKQLNREIEKKMKWWQRKGNCDVSKRFSFNELLRLIEKTRFLQGDILIVKSQGKIQAIESDRICNPTDLTFGKEFKKLKLQDYEHGIKTDKKTGQVIQYLVCSRTSGTGRQLQAIIKAQDAIFVSYKPRIDAYRGVSPLAAAVNNAKDLMDGQAYLLMKIRLTALLGFVIQRQSSDPLSRDTNSGDTDSQWELDMTMEKPSIFDLNPGQKVSVIESGVAKQQTTSFYSDMTMQILRSVGIPFSFYAENFSTFYGSRGALLQYQDSCKAKRQELISMLDQLTRWLIANWILDGSISVPDNMSIQDMEFEWVPAGVQYWKPTEQYMGIGMGVALGQISYADAAKAAGVDYYETIDKIKRQTEYAKEAGVNLILPNINAMSAQSMNNQINQDKG